MTQSQDQSRWIALLVMTSVAVYLCWRMLKPFVNVLIWATILVIVFHPIYKRIAEKTGRPALSAFFSILLVTITVLVPLILVTSAVAKEVGHVADNAQLYIESLTSDPMKSERVRYYLDKIRKYVDLDQITSSGNIRDYAGRISQTIVSGTISVLGGALGFFVAFVFILYTMYYLFRDGEKIVAYLPALLPLEQHQSLHILNRTREIISASVYGIVVIAVLQGALGGVMFGILGVPSAIFWSVVMTLFSTIPMLGSYVIWLPIAIYLILTGHWVKGLILIGWGALVVGMVDNILRPKLVGHRTRMHELVIFFSVLGGISVFGVVGILLGPLVAAITFTLLDVFHQRDVTPVISEGKNLNLG